MKRVLEFIVGIGVGIGMLLVMYQLLYIAYPPM